MKKRLSLLLILIMLLGCAVLSAEAATAVRGGFTDTQKIVNIDAVNMLLDLGIISGYPDGAFQPQGQISRAEACKLIRMIMRGEHVYAPHDWAAFSDLEGHWASSDIYFCSLRGIAEGYEDGQFRPDQSITASELAKMLLVAAGYKKGDYSGANWRVNVDRDAEAAGIYNGFIEPSDAPLNRDNAALLIFGALLSYAVESWEDAVPNYYLDDLNHPKTMLEQHWRLRRYTEVIEANEYVDISSPGERLETGLTRIREHKPFAVSTGLEDIGKMVNIYTDENGKVYGRPTPLMEELCLSVNGIKAFYANMSVNELEYSEDCEFYLDFERIDPAGLYGLGENERFTLIDWQRDGQVDMVLAVSYKPLTVTEVGAGGYLVDTVDFGGYIPFNKIAEQRQAVKAGSLVKVAQIAGRFYIVDPALDELA